MLTLVALCSVLAAEGFVADVAAPRAARLAALRAASAEAADVAPSLSAACAIGRRRPSRCTRSRRTCARGEEVVSLCVGEPDFRRRPRRSTTCAARSDAGETRYTGVSGTLALRDAVVADRAAQGRLLRARRGARVDGAKQSVYQAVLATVGPGDEVIVPAPYWPSYPEIVRLAGATPVRVGASAPSGYALTPEGLAAALRRARGCSSCATRATRAAACSARRARRARRRAALAEHGARVWVLADEIYERLCYADGAPGAGDAPRPPRPPTRPRLPAAAAASLGFARSTACASARSS